MFAWSVRRRVFYFLLVVLFFVIVAVAAFWWWKPAPTCRDGKQNQDELGVDCGGSCPAVCLSEAKDLKVIWTRILKVTDGRYDTATLVANPNRSFGARRFHYKVRVVDDHGIFIAERQGATFINPSENFIVYDSNVNIGQRIPVKAIFQIDESPVWQRVKGEAPSLKVNNKGFTNEPAPRLFGEVKNDSLLDLKNVVVVVALSDLDGNALAVSSTVIEQLNKQTIAEIAFTWPQAFTVNSPIIDFYTHVDLMTGR